MNKIYRIIFNRVTGRMEVVSELAKGRVCGGATVVHDTDNLIAQRAWLGVRLLSSTLMVVLGTATVMLPVNAQQAPAVPTVTTPPPTQIVADPNAPKNQQPTVLPTASGSVQVNIQTPTKAGVSMNQYSQFDVGANGAILNNSRTNVQTQSAGWIQGNPWLAGGTARIIVNQVNSTNPSLLNGNIEVAGDRAEVIMANAAGIQVNGAGFINASRVTLTTGLPQLGSGGALEAYRVSQGNIAISGAGLNTGDADYSQLLARSVQVNAGVWAKQLKVVTGANTINAQDDNAPITANTASGVAPTVALDVGSLGGMYAGKIALIGTEAGLGINNAGTIAASAGDVTIDSNGQLSNAGTIAVNGSDHALSVHAQGLDNSGTLSAQGNATLAIQGATSNSGLLSAGRELTLQSSTLGNTASGTINAQRLDITANTLSNSGKIQQTGVQGLDITAGSVVNANQASLGVAPLTGGPSDPNNPTDPADPSNPPSTSTGGGETTTTTPAPESFATGAIRVANTLSNTDGGVISGNGVTTLNVSAGLQNLDGAKLQVQTLNVSGDSLRNSGEIFYDNGLLNVAHLNNDQGKLGTGSAISLNTQSLSNRGGAITTGQSFTATVAQGVDNTGGTIASQDALAIDADAIDNSQGTLSSNSSSVTLKAKKTIRNDGGTVQSAEDLDVTATDLSNVGGKIVSGGQGTLNVTNDVNNTQGVIVSKDVFTLNANTLNNNQGVIGSQDADTHLNLQAQMQNQGGTVISGGEMALQSNGFDNRDGSLIAKTLKIDAGTGLLNNDRGTLAGNTVDLKSGDLSNDAGLIQAQDALTINANGVLTNSNSGSEKGIRSGNALNINAGTLNNDSGVVIGMGDLSLVTQMLSNQQGQIGTAANLNLQSQDLVNGGSIQAGANANVSVTNALDNSNGQLVAQNALNVTAGSVKNAQGTIASIDGNTAITTAQVLDNSGGTIQSNQNLTLTANGLSNNGGNIAGNAVTIDTQQQALQNQSGSITANTLNISTGIVRNDAGLLQSAGDLTLNTHGQLLSNTGSANAANGQGGIRAGNNLDIQAGDVNNSTGLIGSVAATHLTAGNIDNTQGQIQSGTTLDLSAQSLNNSQGQISGGSDATLAIAGDFNNSAGQVIAAKNLTLTAATLKNTQGTIGSIDGDATISTSGLLDNGQGSIQSSHGLNVTASGLNNQSGLILGDVTTVDTRAQNLQNQLGTIAGSTVRVNSGALSNDTGLIQSINDLHIDTNGQLLSNGNSAGGPNGQGGIRAGSTLELQTGDLDNRAGVIGSGAASTLTAANITNSGGQIAAGTTLTLTAQSLDNTSGQIQSVQDAKVQVAGSVNNTQGQLVAGTALNLSANTITNSNGTLGAIDGDANITTTGVLNNAQGKIQSVKNVTLDTQGLDNTQGVIVGAQTAIDTHAQALNNSQGTIAGSDVAIHSGALNNDAGLLQSTGNLNIDTNGQLLTNTNSGSNAGISAGGDLNITSGDLQNSTGVIAGIGNTTLNTAALSNQSGVIQSQSALNIQGTALSNNQGQILAVGDTSINLGSGLLSNDDGLLQSAANLTVNAASVSNANTISADPAKPLGILASNVTLNADSINNQGGTLSADQTLALNGRGDVNNQGGVISSLGTVAIKDPTYTRTILNEQGAISAGELLDVQVKNVTGKGKLESGLDMALDYADPISNDNTIAANRDLTLKTQGDLTNRGQINAGRNLELSAQNVSNEANGEISAVEGGVHVKAQNLLTNRGLIDGVITHIEGATVDNLGTGRIYGDHVAIAANTLNNADETVNGVTKAGTIAARQRLDIGAQTINNLHDALIYSDGDAAIGGALDANQLATGTATVLNNRSATIDVANDLRIDATALNNVRENVNITQVQSVDETVNMHLASWQQNGSNSGGLAQSSNYRAWQVYYLDPSQILETSTIVTPDGYRIGKAVINVTANTSVYYGALGGLSTDPRAERWRLNPTAGTYTIYYRIREDGQSNPDQVPGGDDPFVSVINPNARYETNTLRYDSAYGTCSSNCVQLVGAWQYNDPNTTIENRIQGYDHPQTEASRIAHHTAVDDVLDANIGTDAIIRSGRDMALTVDTLRNEYGQIAAGRNLVIQDHNGGQGSVTNLGAALFRTHNFNNTSIAYNGGRTAWTNPSLSEQIGQVGGSITAGGTLVIDTGSLDNFNTGRDAPNILSPGAFAKATVGNLPSFSKDGDPSLQQGAANQAVNGQSIATATTDLASTNNGSVSAQPAGGTTTINDGSQSVNNGDVTILTAANPGQVAASSLFAVNPNGNGYFIETDPRFTNYKNWLSSDWMINALGIDPSNIHKRLGDGYYEQKLVRDQIAQLTGRRFLDGYSNDDAQYQALMRAGVTFAQTYGLRPGIALTAEQMARLTSDIVWLVEEEVTLPDGSKVKALVPKVYVAVRNGDITKNGALLAANQIQLNLNKDFSNSGDIAGRNIVAINANNISNLRGGVIGADTVVLNAKMDINNIGATIKAGNAMALNAGNNINIQSTTATQSGSGPYSWSQTTIDRVAGLYVTNPNGLGLIALNTGKDVNLIAATIRNAGTAGVTQIQARGDINLGTVTTGQSQHYDYDAKNYRRSSSTTEVGTTIQGANTVQLIAGNDINAKAAQINAGGAAQLIAGRDISITEGRATTTVDNSTHSQSSGFLSKKSYDEQVKRSTDTSIGSNITAGSTVDIAAGRDLHLRGSNVLGVDNVNLAAGNNVTIESSQDTFHESVKIDQKKSGFTGGIKDGVAGIGYSSSSSHYQSTTDATTQSASGVGSITGNITIKAGNQLLIAGSDVAAGNNLTLIGKDVKLEARQDTVDTHTTSNAKQSGFSIGATVNPVDAYKAGRDRAAAQGGNYSDSTIGKLAQKGEGSSEGAHAATQGGVFQAGSSKSNSQSDVSSSTARTTQLSAGNNLTILATDGSITSQGTQMSAEGSATLLAKQNIDLNVAHNTQTQSEDSKKSGWEIALNRRLPVGVYNQKANGNGSTDTITGTQISAGGGVVMATQEGDITLTATQIAAQNDVNINAARNLTIQSGQDTAGNVNHSNGKAIGSVVISDTERFVGYHNEKNNSSNGGVTQVASNVGSLGGNVNLTAGNTYTQTASNVVAANDVNITAKQIELLAANDINREHQDSKDTKIGVFARVNSPIIDLVNNIDAARKSDGRLATMQGMAAGASAYQAASAISSMAKGPGSGSILSAEAGIGFAQDKSQYDGNSSTAVGSNISGGHNVTLTSTEGDIHGVQANLKAGDTLTLDSAKNIVLEAGKSTQSSDGKSSNVGAEVGVGVSVGAQTGVYVYGQVSAGSSKNSSDAAYYENTHLAGNTINLKSQGDTTLKGADAQGNTINADVGGKLAIESVQDTVKEMSKDSGFSARAQVSFGTAWSVSGNANASKASGSYTAVNQQSGLFAGDGGYHVKADSVDLKGGAITSTNAANSDLTANSLTFEDLQNQMNYKASSASISGSYGSSGKKPELDQKGNPVPLPSAGKQLGDIGNTISNGSYGKANNANFGGGLPMSESGKDSSTTYATLTEGNITIGGKQTSAADLGLHTDAATAHTAIKDLPDLQKVLEDQKAMSAAAGNVISTSQQVAGDIAANAKAQADAIGKAIYNSLSPEGKQTYDQMSPSQREAFLVSQSSDFAQANSTAKNWGTGGDYSRALGAITTALVGGVAGQGTTQVLSNALAPYAAQLIGNTFDPNHGSDPNKTAQVLSHAILGALLAEVNGGSAVGGALAGGGGELAAQYLTEKLFGSSNPKSLTEEQKQMVLGLSSMLGALAGGIASGENGAIYDASVTGNIAKNAVENNWLTDQESAQLKELRDYCKAGNEQACINAKQLAQLSLERDVQLAVLDKRIREQFAAAGIELTDEAYSKALSSYWGDASQVDEKTAGRIFSPEFIEKMDREIGPIREALAAGEHLSPKLKEVADQAKNGDPWHMAAGGSPPPQRLLDIPTSQWTDADWVAFRKWDTSQTLHILGSYGFGGPIGTINNIAGNIANKDWKNAGINTGIAVAEIVVPKIIGKGIVWVKESVVASKAAPSAIDVTQSALWKYNAANNELRAFTYNAIENPGPLADLPNIPAANFFGGRYNSSLLTEDLVLYRGGKENEPLGQWFVRKPPESVAQIRIDSAVKSQWIDPKTGILTGSSPIDNVYAIKIPKGTMIYEGPVGYQGGIYLGGPKTNQVFVQEPWKIPGIQKLWSKPIK